ncbi:hypothetical protein EJB05_43380, partial [Eragrostis curvula]
MDFDDHDDGDEEMAPLPPVLSSSYETPPQSAGFGSGGGAAPKPPPPIGEPGGRAKAPGSGGGGGRYRECLKNHAVGIGGHAVDGCGEFMAAGEEGTLDALRCAACNCHRNFHRKESPTAEGGSPISPAAIVAYGATPHQQFSPYYRTPAGYFHHHQPPHHMAAGRPLALPSTSHSGRDDVDDLSGMAGPMSALGPLSGMSLGAGPSGSGGSGRTRCWLSRSGWGGASRSTTRPPCSSSATRSASSATSSRSGCTTTSTPSARSRYHEPCSDAPPHLHARDEPRASASDGSCPWQDRRLR